jgi:hypothetical protein
MVGHGGAHRTGERGGMGGREGARLGVPGGGGEIGALGEEELILLMFYCVREEEELEEREEKEKREREERKKEEKMKKLLNLEILGEKNKR